MKVYALIQARGGSKTIPKKNIKLLGGFPLIAYSIAIAKIVKCIDRVIVSTDCREIAGIAQKYGAEVPFMRPAYAATDTAGDLEVFQHALKWFDEHDTRPDLFAQLRPTMPLRNPEIVEGAIKRMEYSNLSTSLRSVHEVDTPPQKMYNMRPPIGTDSTNGMKEGFLKGCFPCDPRPEYYNLPRQMFPKAYWGNGHIDVVRPETIETGTMYGGNIIGYEVPRENDIDNLEDWEYAEYRLVTKKHEVYEWLKKFAT